MWIVRVALTRPYTFIVLAILILIASPVVIRRMPTDIFPNIDIPVVASDWTYTGLSPEEFEGRIVSQYERSLSTTVGDIEHIESQTLNGVWVIKIFFQPSRQHQRGPGAGDGDFADGAAADAARHYAAAGDDLQRLHGADPAAFAFQPDGVRAGADGPGHELHALATGHGGGRGGALALRREDAAGDGGREPGAITGERPGAAGRGERGDGAEPDSARRHGEDRRLRIQRGHERQPAHGGGDCGPAGEGGQRHYHLSARPGERAQRLRAADQHRAAGRAARGAAGGVQVRATLPRWIS